MADNKPQIIVPPNLLRAKVGNKPGPDLDQMVASAQAAINEMKNDFEVWIRDDLKALQEAVAAMRQDADPALLEVIKTHAHEIKGQGSTYGYPLLTVVGDLLYRFVDSDAKVAAQNLTLIGAHVDFMALVLSQGIHDQGDAQAQGILAGLQDAARKAHGGTAAQASTARSGS